MADFEPIAVNTTAEKLEKIANMNVLAEKVEEENDNALVSATALLKTLVGNVDLSNYYTKAEVESYVNAAIGQALEGDY